MRFDFVIVFLPQGASASCFNLAAMNKRFHRFIIEMKLGFLEAFIEVFGEDHPLVVYRKKNVIAYISTYYPSYSIDNAKATFGVEPLHCPECDKYFLADEATYYGDFLDGIACCSECSAELTVAWPE